MNNAVQHLKNIEKEKGVTVLYACEAGSRAWGFASKDSDYDVRFIYCRTPEFYMHSNITPKKDTIEKPNMPGDFDVCGWDLAKAYRLLLKGNPPLFEWIHSPIQYIAWDDVLTKKWIKDELIRVSNKYWSPKSTYYHYYNMARRNWKEYLQGDSVRTKKYLYVLRPLLAVRWVQEHSTVPPVQWTDLWSGVDTHNTEFRSQVNELIGEKISGMEDDYGPRRAVISDWIEAEMSALESLNLESAKISPEAIHNSFTAILGSIYNWEGGEI